MLYDATLLQIGNNPQVFVDNVLIEQTDGMTRRWHKPRRKFDQPVMRADQPWEVTPYFTYSNYNVLRDPTDGLIKSWYEDIGPVTPHRAHPWKNYMLYATSRDGVTFDKAPLGKIRIGGKDTNAFMGYVEGARPDANNPWADIGVHSAAVVIDPDTPAERYRMLFSRAREGRDHEIECAYSADGINWLPYGERPSFGTAGRHLSDVSTITYDSETRLFVQYTRHGGMGSAGIPEASPGAAWREGARLSTYFPGRPDLMNKRRVYRTVSQDFLHWTDPVLISGPDDDLDNLDTAHYGVGQFRVGGTHFGTLGVFRYVDNEMEVRLIYSHDGVTWRPTDNGAAFLAPRGGAHWDRHMVSIVSPPLRVGDSWYFYHGGSQCHHDYWWAGPHRQLDHEEAREPEKHVRFGLGIAELRFEGMASLDAVRPRAGRFVTKPLNVGAGTLKINARTRPGGSIRVALCDSNGAMLPGYTLDDSLPFTGDSVRHECRWQGGGAILPPSGRGVFRKLVFAVEEAEIFGFVVDETPIVAS